MNNSGIQYNLTKGGRDVRFSRASGSCGGRSSDRSSSDRSNRDRSSSNGNELLLLLLQSWLLLQLLLLLLQLWLLLLLLRLLLLQVALTTLVLGHVKRSGSVGVAGREERKKRKRKEKKISSHKMGEKRKKRKDEGGGKLTKEAQIRGHKCRG